MTGDLRPVVLEAVRAFGSPSERIFTTATFAEAVWQMYELQRCPNHGWCAAVLDRLGFVRRLSGEYLWLYDPAPQLVPDRQDEAQR